MTTRDFIAKTYNTTAARERRCSSVFTDYQGTVYSYGYHYPLAFNINGLDFVNTRGYSNTTAKHISWAQRALNYEHVSVEINRDDAQVIISSYASDSEKLDIVRAALQRQASDLMAQMQSKKRRDTWVYKNLEGNLAIVLDNIKKVGK